MDLLERYLQAVRFFLPRRHQDDIVRELGEDLRAQMDDRERALGRPLTDDERADVLKRHGHPMLVAGRYRSHQRLIGPAFFPLYVVVLTIGLAICLLVTVVLATVGAVMDGDAVGQAVRTLLAYPGRALMVFAWTTLGFGVLDYALARVPIAATWDPKSLPRVQPNGSWASRFNSAVEFIATMVALAWLLMVSRAPALAMGPAALVLAPAPVWHAAYLPLIAVTVATAAVALANFWRPYWTPARSAARIAIHATSFTIFAALLHAGEWVTARPDAAVHGGPPVEKIVEIANLSCQIALGIACVIALYEIVREVMRWRARRGSATPNGAPILR
jgi:hypothetical protein